MNTRSAAIALLVVAISACGDKGTQPPSKPVAAANSSAEVTKQTSASSTEGKGVGPADLRLGMASAQLLSEVKFETLRSSYQTIPADIHLDITTLGPPTSVSEFQKDGDACFFISGAGVRMLRCAFAEEVAKRRNIAGSERTLTIQDLQRETLTVPVYRELLGRTQQIAVSIEGGKVTNIVVPLGNVTLQDIQTLRDTLAKSYKLVSPTRLETEDFDAKRSRCIAVIDETTRVALVLRNSSGLSAELRYQSPEAMAVVVKNCGPRSLLNAKETKL